MYIPNAYRYDNQDECIAFMRAHSFATLVSVLDGAPVASHVPLVVHADGEQLTLSGHLARANLHWKAFERGETLAIFSGLPDVNTPFSRSSALLCLVTPADHLRPPELFFFVDAAAFFFGRA